MGSQRAMARSYDMRIYFYLTTQVLQHHHKGPEDGNPALYIQARDELQHRLW